jgi:HPt (histidine-containing phosphotransfer) domain-containing protein
MQSALMVLDLTQLRNVTLDDQALMRDVIRALVNDASQRIEELTTAIEGVDSVACIRLAHSAQGACLNVGAASMAALFWSVEQHASNGDFIGCRLSLEKLSIELDKLRLEASAV